MSSLIQVVSYINSINSQLGLGRRARLEAVDGVDCARVKLVADAPHDELLAFDARKSLEKRRDLCANHSLCVEAVESALAEYANDGDVRAIWVVLRVGDLRYPFLSMRPTLVYLRGGRPSTTWAPTPP